jgi:hypothetical protein
MNALVTVVNPAVPKREPHRAQCVQRLAGELQIQRIAELGVQGRERRRLKPVLPGESHDRGVGCLREPEVLNPRQPFIPDDFLDELSPAGQDQRDVRVPAACRRQCPDIPAPLLKTAGPAVQV